MNERSASQERKAESAMLVRAAGILMVVRPQARKAFCPRWVTLSGMVTGVSLGHNQKAASLMVVRLFGIVTRLNQGNRRRHNRQCR